MTKEEFVEMLTDLAAISKNSELIAYRRAEDVPDGPLDDDEFDAGIDNWESLCVRAFGRLCVDDHDEKSRYETSSAGQLTNVTNLYPLDDIDVWPEVLFEKLVSYTWVVQFGNKINVLDAIVKATRPPPKPYTGGGGMATWKPPDSGTDLPPNWV